MNTTVPSPNINDDIPKVQTVKQAMDQSITQHNKKSHTHLMTSRQICRQNLSGLNNTAMWADRPSMTHVVDGSGPNNKVADHK